MGRMSLDDILGEDDSLLDVKLSSASSSTQDQRIVSELEAINVFIDRHGCKPGETEKPAVSERALQLRLAGLLEQTEHHDSLRPFDKHDLLPCEIAAVPQSLDDIFEDDLLATSEDDIFNLVHVKPVKAKADEISEREKCHDFEQFKPLFDQCCKEIEQGSRKTIAFAREQEISAGEFFILNGIMVYVAEVGETHLRNGKSNARLRLIFDNETEGKNLLRSLATALYKDPNGRRVSSPDAGPLFDARPEEEDTQTGMIYVVKSLSTDPEIIALDGMLHKIGFTSGKMEVRIANAQDDPTFLMAKVHPVATYTLYNIDKVKLEHLLHNFFADAPLDIEITDRFGKKVRPREWFLVRAEIISEAISRLQDGSIINYRFDIDRGGLMQI